MTRLHQLLAEHGGVGAAAPLHAQLRAALDDALVHGAAELGRSRSGSRERPVEVAFAATGAALAAAVPVDAALRADPAVAGERGWIVAAAAVGALVATAGLPAPAAADALSLTAGDHAGHLALVVAARDPDPELAALHFDVEIESVDRLRAAGRALPPGLIDPADLRPPAGAAHPLRVAEATARLGGRPADPESLDSLEEAVLAILDPPEPGAERPHEDPDPALRVARRIVQRLAGMGKWGGYHTDFAHVARGFKGNEREHAVAVGEALLEIGLLGEKPSVGQRHVFLNPRRAGDVYALRDEGRLPAGARLPKL